MFCASTKCCHVLGLIGKWRDFGSRLLCSVGWGVFCGGGCSSTHCKDVDELPVLPRLQTGMRGAFGKPQGTVARVHIGQIIMSVRTKDNHKASAIEAFRRAKFKFPGRQKVGVLVLAIVLWSCIMWCLDICVKQVGVH
jgi:hypothetical protein